MTSIYLYSREQGKVVDSAKGLHNIGYSDIETAIHTLVWTVIRKWHSGQSSILVVPNESYRWIILEMFEFLGLATVVLDCKPSQQMQREDFDKLRNSLNQNSPIKDDPSILQFQFDRLNEETKKEFDDFHKIVFDGLSWISLLRRYVALVPKSQVLVLHRALENFNFNFNPTEFEEIKSNLSDGLFLYSKDFELNDAVQINKNLQINVQSLDRLQDLSYEIFTFKELAIHNRDSAFRFLTQIKTKWLNEFHQNLSDARDKLAFLVFSFEKYNESVKNSKKPNFIASIFSNTEWQSEILLAQLKTGLVALYDFLLQHHIIANKKIKNALHIDFEESFKDIAQWLDEWEKNIASTVKLKIKAINKFNLQDEYLVDLESDIQQLVHRINQAKIFDAPYELNTLSFSKQVDFTDQLVIDLDTMLAKIEINLPYYQWMIYYNGLPITSQQVINSLRHMEPESWLQVFESWYFYEILTQNRPYSTASHKTSLNKSTSTYISVQQSEIEKRLSIYAAELPQTIKSYKKEAPLLYDLIINNKQKSALPNWKVVLEEHITSLSKGFPILILSEDNLQRFNPKSYSFLGYIDVQDYNLDLLQQFETVHNYIDKELIGQTPVDLVLSTPYLSVDSTFGEKPISEKWELVKKIAQSLVMFDIEPQIFKLRGGTIISFVHESYHPQFIDELYHLGIKETLLEGSVYETIVATFLESDQKIYIITQDNLLNARAYDDYLYQRHIIGQLEDSGCQILNIDHKDLLESNGQSLKSLIEEIKEHGQSRFNDHKIHQTEIF